MRLTLLDDLRALDRARAGGDVLAGTITAVLLVPQALAYALLAGLPPEMGLYASILPPVVYALLGSSRTLAVGASGGGSGHGGVGAAWLGRG